MLRDLYDRKIQSLTHMCCYRENKRTYWICKCECGKLCIRRQDSNKDDCGCKIARNKQNDILGYFKIIKDFSKTEKDHRGKVRSYCLAECQECMSVREYRRDHVLNKNMKSCGCSRRTCHGMSNHYLYKTYNNIKSRCNNQNNHAYKDYGMRGIKLYPEWDSNFKLFVEYIQSNLGDRPEGYTLDRIDNNKGYEPNNLKWSDHKEQCNNKRQVKSNFYVSSILAENQILKDKIEYLNNVMGELI